MRWAHEAAGFLAALQQVGRLQGAQAHHAGQAIAAVLRGGRAAQHLDGRGGVRRQQIAAVGGEGAERKRIGHADAVHQDQHLVAFQSADVDAFVAGAAGGGPGSGEAAWRGTHRDVEFVAEHILGVACARFFDVGGADHRDGAGHVVHQARRARGGDGGFRQRRFDGRFGQGRGAGHADGQRHASRVQQVKVLVMGTCWRRLAGAGGGDDALGTTLMRTIVICKLCESGTLGLGHRGTPGGERASPCLPG